MSMSGSFPKAPVPYAPVSLGSLISNPPPSYDGGSAGSISGETGVSFRVQMQFPDGNISDSNNSNSSSVSSSSPGSSGGSAGSSEGGQDISQPVELSLASETSGGAYLPFNDLSAQAFGISGRLVPMAGSGTSPVLAQNIETMPDVLQKFENPFSDAAWGIKNPLTVIPEPSYGPLIFLLGLIFLQSRYRFLPI